MKPTVRDCMARRWR